MRGEWPEQQGVLFPTGNLRKDILLLAAKVRAAAATVIEPQLVRVDSPEMSSMEQMFEIRYGSAELRLPEDVDLKALAVFLNTLRHHD